MVLVELAGLLTEKEASSGQSTRGYNHQTNQWFFPTSSYIMFITYKRVGLNRKCFMHTSHKKKNIFII